MDEFNELPSPRAVLVGSTVIVAALVLGALVFLGGQTSTILSKVGAAITSGGEAPVVEPRPADAGGEVDAGGEIADAAAKPPELLIIRTGQLELEVTDLAAAVDAARRSVAAAGGYIASSSEAAAAGDEASASATYRIPADRWDATFAAIRGMASRVRHAAVETEAVTGQVVDLEARISNLRATETALQAIMSQATRIDDVLSVQRELTGVRGEIEQLVGQKESLEERAALGTLSVVFRLPVTPVVEEVQQGWDPATDVDEATGTLLGIGQTAASLGIWLAIVWLPILLVGLIVVAVGWRLVRLVRGAARSAEPA